jgi:hypothetical protein
MDPARGDDGMGEEIMKLCPFCGKLHGVTISTDMHFGKTWSIDCSHRVVMQVWGEFAVSGMVDRWNTRPIEDALRAQLAEARAEANEMRDKLWAAGVYREVGTRETVDYLLKWKDTEAQLAAAKEDADRLAALVEKVEWVMGADENSYCAWCGNPEVSKPDAEWYVDHENSEFDSDTYNDHLYKYEHPHKPDCPRQIALAAHDALKE